MYMYIYMLKRKSKKVCLYQEECNKELQQHQSPYLKLLALQLFRDLYFFIFTKVSNNAYNKLH